MLSSWWTLEPWSKINLSSQVICQVLWQSGEKSDQQKWHKCKETFLGEDQCIRFSLAVRRQRRLLSPRTGSSKVPGPEWSRERMEIELAKQQKLSWLCPCHPVVPRGSLWEGRKEGQKGILLQLKKILSEIMLELHMHKIQELNKMRKWVWIK